MPRADAPSTPTRAKSGPGVRPQAVAIPSPSAASDDVGGGSPLVVELGAARVASSKPAAVEPPERPPEYARRVSGKKRGPRPRPGPSLPTRVAVALGLQRQPTVIDVHFEILSGFVVQVNRIDSKESINKKFDVHCENWMPSGD